MIHIYGFKSSKLIYSSFNFRQVESLLVISLCGPISETAYAAFVGVMYLNIIKNVSLSVQQQS